MSSKNLRANPEAFNKLLKTGRVTANDALSLNPKGGLWVNPEATNRANLRHVMCDLQRETHNQIIRPKSNLMAGLMSTALVRNVDGMMAGVALLPMRL
jgi:hypothetical protein